MVVVIIALGIGSYFVLNNNKKNFNENEKTASDVLDNSKTDKSSDKSNTSKSSSQKILVAYFSKAGENYGVGTVDIGNTALMASYIVDYLKASSFEIVPVKPYPDNYEEAKQVATKEKRDDARPEIKNKIDNFQDYDVIFIGYPIWYGEYPMIINTFLESYDFKGKTVIPFNTHEGSGSSTTYEDIKNKLKSSNVVTDGLALEGKKARTDDGRSEVIKWLESLDY